MYIKQLSVFMENREGRLGEVLSVLKKENININSLSLADSSDYGLLRLIVDKPEEAKDALKSAGLSAKLTDVIGVKISHKVGALEDILEVLCKAHVNIEYMYALATDSNDASIVFKTSEPEKVAELIETTDVDLVDVSGLQG